MPPLTWRNVDAPDFRGSLQGFAATGDMLNNAAQGVNDAIRNIKQQQTQDADGKALSQALSYSNPNDYATALSNGSILAGVNPSNLSDRAYALLSDKYGSLINDQSNQQQQNIRDYSFNREKQTDNLLDKASPLINSSLNNALQGNYTGAQQAFNSPEISNLDPNTQAALSGRLVNIQDANSNRDMRQSQESRASNEYRDQQDGINLGTSVAPNVLNIDNGVATIRNSNASPMAKAVAEKYLLSNPNLIGSKGISNPLALSAGNTTFGNGRYGQQPVDLNNMSIGDRQNYGQNQIDLTRGKIDSGNNGTSALGMFQLTNPTVDNYAPKILGSNYKSLPNSPENNYKIAEAAWNDNAPKGNALNTWPSLKNKFTANQLKTMPFSQVAPYIVNGETGLPIESAQQALQFNTNTNKSVENIPDFRTFGRDYQNTDGLLTSGSTYLNNLNNSNSMGGLVSSIISNDPRYRINPNTGALDTSAKEPDEQSILQSYPKNTDLGKISGALSYIQSKANINTGTANAILQKSIEENSHFYPWSRFPSIGNDQQINYNTIDKHLNDYKNGNLDNAIDATMHNTRLQNSIVQTQQLLAQRRQAVEDGLRQLQNNPNLASQVKPLIDNYTATQAQANGLINSVGIKSK